MLSLAEPAFLDGPGKVQFHLSEQSSSKSTPGISRLKDHQTDAVVCPVTGLTKSVISSWWLVSNPPILHWTYFIFCYNQIINHWFPVSIYSFPTQTKYDQEEINGKKKERRMEGGREAASFTTRGANGILNKPGKQQTWLLENIYDSGNCVTSLKHTQWEQAF